MSVWSVVSVMWVRMWHNIYMRKDYEVICMVCLNGLQVGDDIAILSCGHTVHERCIRLFEKYRDDSEGWTSCPSCVKSFEKAVGLKPPPEPKRGRCWVM